MLVENNRGGKHTLIIIHSFVHVLTTTLEGIPVPTKAKSLLLAHIAFDQRYSQLTTNLHVLDISVMVRCA